MLKRFEKLQYMVIGAVLMAQSVSVSVRYLRSHSMLKE